MSQNSESPTVLSSQAFKANAVITWYPQRDNTTRKEKDKTCADTIEREQHLHGMFFLHPVFVIMIVLIISGIANTWKLWS